MKNRRNKGITLIALVITIIVMLILVAVTITVAVNGGLFDYAKKASDDTIDARNKEQNRANIPAGQNYQQLIDKFSVDE